MWRPILLWRDHVLGSLVILLTTTTTFLQSQLVSGAAVPEWSLGPSEEYVTAFINLTYLESNKLHTEKSEIGRFGGGKVGPASGLVVHIFSINKTEVHHGCEYPFGNQIPKEPWIALIKRGNCSFDKKLENAFRSNASGMVVYAREDKEQLEKMSFKNCNYCDIPTVFTYRWKGDEIARKVDSGIAVYMYITVGESCTRPYNGINRTSVLFVSISFIVLMIISLAWLVFYYVQRFRYLHAKDRLAQRLCNAAKKALAKIPTRNIKLSDKEIAGEGDCCAVCIDLYRSGDTLRTLPCKHEFHKQCVDPWLLEHRTCPMCKMDILKYYGFFFTGSQESILHMDIEDGTLNSSESRDDSPVREGHHHFQTQTMMTINHRDDSQREPSSGSTIASQTSPNGLRKPSLISLALVASPRGCDNCDGRVDLLEARLQVPETESSTSQIPVRSASMDKIHLSISESNSKSSLNYGEPNGVSHHSRSVSEGYRYSKDLRAPSDAAAEIIAQERSISTKIQDNEPSSESDGEDQVSQTTLNYHGENEASEAQPPPTVETKMSKASTPSCYSNSDENYAIPPKAEQSSSIK